MRRYVNLDTLELQERADFAVPIITLEVKRGDNRALEFQFVRAGLPVDLNPTGTTIDWVFGAKVADDFDGSHVFKSTTFTKTNGTRFTDAVLNSTTTVTSATAAFTQDDVGKTITATGIPADTTISAVGSATSITLSAAATATATGVTITILNRDTYYTVTPSLDTTKGNNLLGYDVTGFAEVVEIRCVADIDDSLDGQYFVLADAAGTVGVWIDVDNSGTTIPAGAAACDRAIEITTIVTGDSAATVAAAIAAVLEADAAFTASDSGALVTVTSVTIGTREAPTDGNSSFGVTRWIAGSDPLTMTNVEYVDLDAEVEWVISGVRTSTETFVLRLHFDVNQDGEGSPVASYNLIGRRGVSAIGNGVEYLDVTFSTAFAAAPNLAGTPCVEKASTGDANVFCTGVASLTASGFRAYFSAATPNANYTLHWLALTR